MTKRIIISQKVQSDLLSKSLRRCCICFCLLNNHDLKKGQIAHLDHNSSNSELDNLAFLCWEHHEEYDSKTRQSKGLTIGEIKIYRDRLYAYNESYNETPIKNKKIIEKINEIELISCIEFIVYGLIRIVKPWSSYTTDDIRRYINLIDKMNHSAIFTYNKFKNSYSTVSEIESIFEKINIAINEVYWNLPSKNTLKRFKITENIRQELFYSLEYKWKDILSEIFIRNPIENKYNEFLHSERRWNTWGFDDQNEFSRTIKPDFERLWEGISLVEIKILKYICERNGASIREMKNYGFPIYEIQNVYNALYQSKYIFYRFGETDDDTYWGFSEMGKDIVKSKLQEKGIAIQST